MTTFNVNDVNITVDYVTDSLLANSTPERPRYFSVGSAVSYVNVGHMKLKAKCKVWITTLDSHIEPETVSSYRVIPKTQPEPGNITESLRRQTR